MLMALQIGGFEVYQLQGRSVKHSACQVTIRSPVLFIRHFAEWERLGALQTFCPLLEISPDTGEKGQRAPRFLGGAGRPLQ